ncbi:MAG: GTPase HflX [Candidatus Omnitrophica bacterium]|nr:GTPase HflX [Candidatus Omnitrophota bacterium]
MKETAVLVTPNFDSFKTNPHPEESSKELEELARSAGLEISRSIVIRQKLPNAALLIGKGRAEELRVMTGTGKAGVVVFNSDLTSTQQRNLEAVIGQKTIDRTQLILDIFAQRARSTEGKLQVELAQLKYLLPRLTGKGIFLSRLGGGVGTRGPGEQKLEVDRRRIRERITRLTRSLGDLQKRRLAGIERKKKKDLPLVALVGYTHAGKSTLFNALTRSDVAVRHQLFSTLDTTTRLLEIADGQRALLADTVGFVRDLPHPLVESFKATLEETTQADLLLHVLDSSRPDRERLELAVEKVLKEIGALKTKRVLVLNKVDLLTEAEKGRLYEDPRWAEGVPVSALKKEGLAALLEQIAKKIFSDRRLSRFFIPKDRLGLIHFFYEEGKVVGREDVSDGVWLTVYLTENWEKILKKKIR